MKDITERTYDNEVEEFEDYKRFVEMNPYPPYGEMIDRIRKDGALGIQMFCEYGQQNHEWVKRVYENIHDEKVCREFGQKIYDRGGHQAMAMNYYVLTRHSPAADSRNSTIRSLVVVVKHWWNGVGEWRM